MANSVVTEAKGERAFVIGDIHGCVKELEVLLNYVEKDQALSDKDVVIFIGDYIDRGSESKAVVDVVLDLRRRFPKTRFLRGNHEDMLIDFLGFGGNLGQSFLYNGGLETIQSYGISVFAPPSDMISNMPPDHFKFYCELESMISIDKFICVHAGLNPLRELTAQNDSDIFWIRDEFINSIHHFNKTIVFGHTPHREMFEHLPYKLGIDTGLVFGNKITCVELFSGDYFQVARDTNSVMTGNITLTTF
ncbi:MAG: serine/threonine protein phosphatase [Proteobacteria bacterium]|nr:serine/threonine protein phosphatase [Pseudomonadota bacterium]